MFSFSRSVDSAGQAQTPPHRPLFSPSALASVPRKGERGETFVKQRDVLHLLWILMPAKLQQMRLAKAILIRTQAGGTMLQKNLASCQNTKQVTAQSQT